MFIYINLALFEFNIEIKNFFYSVETPAIACNDQKHTPEPSCKENPPPENRIRMDSCFWNVFEEYKPQTPSPPLEYEDIILYLFYCSLYLIILIFLLYIFIQVFIDNLNHKYLK